MSSYPKINNHSFLVDINFNCSGSIIVVWALIAQQFSDSPPSSPAADLFTTQGFFSFSKHDFGRAPNAHYSRLSLTKPPSCSIIHFHFLVDFIE